jgi:hypothetical protein
MCRILNHRQKNHFYANKKSVKDITIEIAYDSLCIRTYEYVQNLTYVVGLDIQTRFFKCLLILIERREDKISLYAEKKQEKLF